MVLRTIAPVVIATMNMKMMVQRTITTTMLMTIDDHVEYDDEADDDDDDAENDDDDDCDFPETFPCEFQTQHAINIYRASL